MQSVRPQGEDRLGAQFWRSADGGASWAKVGAQMAATRFNEMYQLVAHPVTANRLYLATQSGLWVTADAGATWTKVGGGLPGAQCRSVAISPDGKTLYASIQSTTAASNGVWRSVNGGTSWTRVYDGASRSSGWPSTGSAAPRRSTSSCTRARVRTWWSRRAPSGPWTKPPVTPMLGYETDSYHQRLSTKTAYDGLIARPGKAGVLHRQRASGGCSAPTTAAPASATSSLGFTGINFARS